MLISAKLIKKPRQKRYCASCEKIMYGAQLRLYGAAFESDPPYVIYLHGECVGFNDRSGEAKIKKALDS
jgi:hypothetical protein